MAISHSRSWGTQRPSAALAASAKWTSRMSELAVTGSHQLGTLASGWMSCRRYGLTSSTCAARGG